MGKRIYPLNENYFKNNNNEDVIYWIGFLSADGNVSDENVLSLMLKYSDIDHIEKFKNAIQPQKPIGIKISKKPYGKLARFDVSSKEICNDLFQYGIIPRKTKFLSKHPIIPYNMIRHYFRGYVDGDGSICILNHKSSVNGKRYKDYSFSVVGNYDFLVNFQNWLILQDNSIIKNNIRTHKTIFEYKKCGRKQVKKILNILYNNSNIYLDRKYKIAKQIMES